MKWANGITQRALQRHGTDLPYTTITRVVDEIEGTVIETPTSYTIRMYPKQVQTSQYNFPTLVGKQVVMFYVLASSLTVVPKPSDEITYNGDVYRINSYQSHFAQGQVVLYKLLGVKG